MKTLSHQFMSCLLISMLWCLPSLSFANESERLNDLNSVELLELVDAKSVNENIPANSCYADYLKLRRKTILRTVAAPVIGYAAVYALAYTGGLVFGTTGNNGSGSLAGLLVGVILGAYVGLITYVVNQSFALVRLVKVHNYVKLIEQSYLKKGRKLRKIAKKLKTNVEFVAESIIGMNESGVLCDGSLRGRGQSSKLRKRLARKKDIINHIKTLL